MRPRGAAPSSCATARKGWRESGSSFGRHVNKHFFAAQRPHITAFASLPVRSFCLWGAWLLVLGAVLAAMPAFGMSWSWTPLAGEGGRPAGEERLSFVLDNPGQVRRLVRGGSSSLLLSLDGGTPTLERRGPAPAAGSLLEGLGISNGQIRINLSSRAVSHNLRRPSPKQIDIEIFAAGAQPEASASQQGAAPLPAAPETPVGAVSPAGSTAAASAADLPPAAVKEALNRSRKVVDEVFQGAASMLALMDICEVGNRVPEALEWLQRYNAFVPKNSPEYPGLRFREARLYRKLGDATRAQALLEDIVRNHADSPFAKAATAELHTFEVSRDLQSYMPGGQQKAPEPQPAAKAP